MARGRGLQRYLPAEDTRLLRDALEPFSGDSCLEIGFGSGAALEAVSARFRLAAGTDVLDVEGARLSRSPKVDLVLADKAACFRDGVFDLVFFNPPYLPSRAIEDVTVDGGRGGVEVPLSFLDDGLRVLKKDGVMIALLSDAGDLASFVGGCEERGIAVEEVVRERLFYESLVIFKIRPRRREG